MGFFKKLFSARRTVTRAMEAQEARLSALPHKWRAVPLRVDTEGTVEE